MKYLSMHIQDILENSVRAKASEIKLIINDSKAENLITVVFSDNGCGMDAEMVRNVLDPFTTTRTTRKIGLGLSLFQQNAQRCGGDLSISSQVGIGTTVTVTFQRNNIDLPPWGDLAGTLVQLMISYREINFIYSHTTSNGEFSVQSAELLEIICENGIPVLSMINPVVEMINNNLQEIGAFN